MYMGLWVEVLEYNALPPSWGPPEPDNWLKVEEMWGAESWQVCLHHILSLVGKKVG